MKKLIIVLLLTFTKILYAQVSYLCISEKSTGFQYNKSRQNWEFVQFNNKEKYVIKNTSSTWDVRKMGDSNSLMLTCTKSKPNTIVDCTSVGEHFTFNPVGMKYIYYLSGGYAVPALFPDTPLIEIGVCSPI